MTSPTKPSVFPGFGAPPSTYDSRWLSAFAAQLTRRLGLLAGPNTIQPQILLQAQDGTVYQVTVSNTGTLTTTVASRGGIQPPI